MSKAMEKREIPQWYHLFFTSTAVKLKIKTKNKDLLARRGESNYSGRSIAKLTLRLCMNYFQAFASLCFPHILQRLKTK